jgi:hypothetical protein
MCDGRSVPVEEPAKEVYPSAFDEARGGSTISVTCRPNDPNPPPVP